jgi:tetratricopeptide (TPR) repeat protein
LLDSLAIDKLHGHGFLARALGKVGQLNQELALIGEPLTIGQLDQALARIDEALTIANKAKANRLGDLYGLSLIKGQLLLMKNPSGLRKAKQCFSIAIEIARKQKAKSEELAAAIQLARVLVQQTHREQARSMLKKIYNWFTEGFDTADLKEAKALLDEFNS